MDTDKSVVTAWVGQGLGGGRQRDGKLGDICSTVDVQTKCFNLINGAENRGDNKGCPIVLGARESPDSSQDQGRPRDRFQQPVSGELGGVPCHKQAAFRALLKEHIMLTADCFHTKRLCETERSNPVPEHPLNSLKAAGSLVCVKCSFK